MTERSVAFDTQIFTFGNRANMSGAVTVELKSYPTVSIKTLAHQDSAFSGKKML